MKRKYDIFLSVFWLGLALFVTIVSFRIGIGTINRPGPGLFPFGLGIAFFIFASLILIQALLSANSQHETEVFDLSNLKKAVVVVLILLAYALSFHFLGYFIAMSFTLAFLFSIGGYRSWWRIAVYTVVIVTLTHFLFSGLGVRLPAGLFRI